MGRIIAIANQKGGVGKTTTAINLSACLAEKGQKVLAIDMDPQGNMSSGLGLDKDSIDKTIYDMIIGESDVEEVINHGTIDNLDILPSNVDLSAVEIELIDVDNKEFVVRDAIQKIRDNYDYIIIDTPPAFNILTLNGYSAADYLIIPMSAEILSLVGLVQLKETYETVRQSVNPQLKIMGIILTKYEKRRKLSRDVLEMAGTVAEQLNTKVFKTVVRSSVAAAEAPAHGVNIFEYSAKSAPAKDYGAIVKEILRIVEEDETNGKKDE